MTIVPPLQPCYTLDDVYVWHKIHPQSYLTKYPPCFHLEMYTAFIVAHPHLIDTILFDCLTFLTSFNIWIFYMSCDLQPALFAQVLDSLQRNFSYEHILVHLPYIHDFLNIDYVYRDGHTLLSMCVENMDLPAADLCLKHGASKNVITSMYHPAFLIHTNPQYGEHTSQWCHLFPICDTRYIQLYYAVLEDNIDKARNLLKTRWYQVDFPFMHNFCILTFASSTQMCNLLLEHSFYFFGHTKLQRYHSVDYFVMYKSVLELLINNSQLHPNDHPDIQAYYSKKKRKLDELLPLSCDNKRAFFQHYVLPIPS